MERCCSASSAHGTARTEAQRLGLLSYFATSNFRRTLGMGESLPLSLRSPAPKMRTSTDSTQSEGVNLESCCSASSAHGTARTEAQRLGLLPCLATSNFKSIRGWESLSIASSRPAHKMQTSPDSSQPEGASLPSFCSASSAHGTARTEAQTLGMLACLATSNFQCSPGMGMPVARLQHPCSENDNFFRKLTTRRG